MPLALFSATSFFVRPNLSFAGVAWAFAAAKRSMAASVSWGRGPLLELLELRRELPVARIGLGPPLGEVEALERDEVVGRLDC